MEHKELKSHLKSAREAIRLKNYKEALKSCKAILTVEKDNYNALVFVGVAAEGLEQNDQALAAYRKAVEVDDNQLLAWQGMCSFFEKQDNPEYSRELAAVYQRLVHFFESDSKKKCATQKKLADLYKKRGMFSEAFQVVSAVINNSMGDEVELELWKTLVVLYNNSTDLPNEDGLILVERGFQEVLKDPNLSSSDKQPILEEYLHLLLKVSNSRERLLQECLKAKTEFPMSLTTLDLLCQIYLFSWLDKGHMMSLDITDLKHDVQSKTLELVPLLFFETIELMEKKQFSDAKEKVMQGIQRQSILPAFIMLAKIYLGINNVQSAEKCIEKANHLLEKKDLCTYGTDKISIRHTIDLVHVEVLFRKGQANLYQVALTLVEKIIENEEYRKEGLILKGNVLIKIKDYDQAKKVVSDLELVDTASSLCLQGKISMLNNFLEKAIESFQTVLSMAESNSEVLFYLGKIYWDMCKTNTSYEEISLSYLLKAAKADPYYSHTFLYLGYFYEHVQKDIVKAKKCYQKSYNLDSFCEEAGVALVDILNLLEQEHQALQILETVTTRASAGTCKWGWLRLGLYYLKAEDFTNAITSLQSSLRADPSDYNCWECLGEAYLKRGSYTAACKTFTKATELQPDSIYSFYQIATIKLTLGVYPEAVAEYQKILDKSPEYVPALKGLGETYLLQGKAAIREFFHGRAVDYCKEAICHLTRAAYKRPDFSCLWKLLGDCCSILNVIPQDLCSIDIPSVLLGADNSIENNTKLEKLEILALGSRCYGMALKCQPSCSSLYNDLGVSYYNHALLVTDNIMSKNLMGKAFQALEKAVRLDSMNLMHWNALGLVALSKEIDNKGLAQHCFIKSIKAEQNNVVAWTNLGVLYMQCDDIKLAHEAFKVAQSLEPSYVASWIGQAIIAETVGQDDEAMDLLRHSTGLTTHLEGALGYAHHVCTILQDKVKVGTEWNKYIIEHMYAVAAASDVLAKYTGRVKNNATAFNLYGLLLEKQKLYGESVKAFDSAVQLLQESGSSKDFSKAEVNLARVLVHTGNYKKAVNIYKQAGNSDSFEEKCSYALALYNMKYYADAFEQYELSLSLTTSDEDQSHVYAAMGMVKYLMSVEDLGTGDVEAAKTQLFKCIQSSSPSLHGLNGLLALGLIQADLTLASAAVQELAQFVKPETSDSFVYMVASLHALKGETVEGKRTLAKLIHSQPNQPSGWSFLVQYLLTHETDLTNTVSRCCHIGLAMDVKKQHKELSTWLALALLGTGQHSRTKPKYSCHSAAQKAVFLYPDNMENWVALISTMYSELITMRCLNNKEQISSSLLPLITHFMAKVEALLSQKEGNTPRLQALHLWCVKQYVVSLIAGDRSSQANQFLQQALWLYEEDQPLQNLLAFLNQNFSVLKLNAVNDSHGFTRQMLVKLYLVHGLVEEAEQIFKMWLPQARTKPRKILALVRLAFFTFKQILKGGDNAVSMKTVFTHAYDECMKIESQVSVFHFMVGVLAVFDGNNKQSKKSIQTAQKYYNDNHHLTYGKTLASKQLLLLMIEKQDDESIQELLCKVQNEGDQEFLDFAKQKIDISKYTKDKKDEE